MHRRTTLLTPLPGTTQARMEVPVLAHPAQLHSCASAPGPAQVGLILLPWLGGTEDFELMESAASCYF